MDTAWIILVAFWALTLGVLATAEGRAQLRARTRAEWTLDLVGLLVQGTLIPLLQVGLVVAGLAWLVPAGRGALEVPGWAALLLNLVAVDYLYYWNHRLLHTNTLWPLHRVHHTLRTLDVLGTSRNTLYSSLFIVYLWVGGALLYFLSEPFWFALGAALTAALDLWRHSPFTPRRGGALHRALSAVLILPSDHAWHHSTESSQVNFGANLSWWDRLHGTYQASTQDPASLGIPFAAPLGRQLFFPFDRRAGKLPP